MDMVELIGIIYERTAELSDDILPIVLSFALSETCHKSKDLTIDQYKWLNAIFNHLIEIRGNKQKVF